MTLRSSAPNTFWPRSVSADTLALLHRMKLSVASCREDTPMDAVLYMVNAMSPRRTNLVDGEGQRVEIDYLLAHDHSKMHIDAFACRNNQSYVCAIHEAFYDATIDLAYGVFSDPGFLPRIGDVRRLTPPPRDLELGRRVISGASLRAIVPNCPRRRLAANLLIVLMNAVVMLHEEGHVVRGHAGFLHAQKQRPWSEHMAFSNVTASPLFDQMLEQEADVFALLALFSDGWVEIITKNFAKTCDFDSRQLMTLCWLASALVGGLLYRPERIVSARRPAAMGKPYPSVFPRSGTRVPDKGAGNAHGP